MSDTILVSACLLGLRTRYDGGSKANSRVLAYLAEQGLTPIPVCPEQLAGLPTPRPRTFFAAGDGAGVLEGSADLRNDQGETVNALFRRGAEESLRVARLAGCTAALLKERSPSCGCRQIYRGAEIVSGQGVTAALLQRSGLRIFSEEELA